jgi:ribonuclease HI
LVTYGDVWKRNGWKKTNGESVRNIDLLEPLISLYQKNKHSVSLNFVKAHTGERTQHATNNNVADALAKRGTV